MPVKWARSVLLCTALASIASGGCRGIYSRLVHQAMPPETRPAEIVFPVRPLAIDRFREAEIRAYEGPATCIRCHAEIEVEDEQGRSHQVSLLDDVTGSAHYRLFTDRHPNVYGFNGQVADNFPMGKIDRPCPKPGSFVMTSWAELVVSQQGDTFSTGCGQCHIGGQYAAPLGEIMPGYRTLPEEKHALDCLICHSVAYDLNQKVVVVDDDGRTRWGQDRSLRAALTVGIPISQNCLRCHQHNFGGDVYVDETDPSFMQNIVDRGEPYPRVLHPGSKRGTPFSPSWDVHARAGVGCLDCHESRGHRIAKGTHTTTLMANDLPDVQVSCENCHARAPHRSDRYTSPYLNMHVDIIACQTCHIPSLHPDNVTLCDFSRSVYDADDGLYGFADILKDNEPGKGIIYRWWNGSATFFGNPIGDRPDGEGSYRFYDPTHVWPEFAGFDYAGWYESVMKPIARQGRSKLYAMKLYNGRQHIDLGNIGPFGGMLVPYNLPVYHSTGDPLAAAAAEMEKGMMKKMYSWMFKKYLLDRFLSFLDVDEWNIASYADVAAGRNIEARWIPHDACLEIDHAIRREGALGCADCHSPWSVLDFRSLGYSEEEIAALSEQRVLR